MEYDIHGISAVKALRVLNGAIDLIGSLIFQEDYVLIFPQSAEASYGYIEVEKQIVLHSHWQMVSISTNANARTMILKRAMQMDA